jgi:hypothetical protein
MNLRKSKIKININPLSEICADLLAPFLFKSEHY